MVSALPVIACKGQLQYPLGPFFSLSGRWKKRLFITASTHSLWSLKVSSKSHFTTRPPKTWLQLEEIGMLHWSPQESKSKPCVGHLAWLRGSGFPWCLTGMNSFHVSFISYWVVSLLVSFLWCLNDMILGGMKKVSIFNCYYFLVATSLVSTFGYYSENKSLATSLPHYFLTLYSLRWCFFFTNKRIISIGLKDYIYFTIVPRKNSWIDYMLCIFLEVGISFSTSVR